VRGSTLAVAESLTGGGCCERLVEVPGSGEVVLGALVAYAGSIKRALLDVPVGPVVSEQAARAMATGVCDLMGADVGLSLTGVAGPERQDDQPVGTVWIGTSVGGRSQAHRFLLSGSPDDIRGHAVELAIGLLVDRLLTDAER
jgi:nicotinamide-nucleotide amidase